MENYRQLYESMFNKNLADEDARDFLLDITEKYPFFSPAQFLLLYKTAKTDADYKQQLIKTAAAFNNNYWLNYLLLQQDKEAFIESFSAEETIADTPLQDGFVNSNEPAEQPIIPDESKLQPDEDEKIAPVAYTNGTGLPGEERHTEAIIPIQAEMAEAGGETQAPVMEENALSIANETFSTEEAPTAEEEMEAAPITSDQAVLSITADELANGNENNDKTAEDSFSNEPINTAFENIAGEEVALTNQEIVNTTDEGQQAEDLTGQEQPDAAEEENFSSPLKTDLAEAAAILDTKPVENGPLFEPLHTTDYFASVGIKLSDEIKPGDRLGSQLKSFTEWLKTMKKLHPTQTAHAAETSEKQNSNIMQLAEKSNKEDEIITEAMADVLMQQGRIDKAVEVLKKLSLLNPSKNTYFAAKIDKLKEE